MGEGFLVFCVNEAVRGGIGHGLWIPGDLSGFGWITGGILGVWDFSRFGFRGNVQSTFGKICCGKIYSEEF